MSAVELDWVPYLSLEYLEAVKLRDEILRKPLGLSLTAQDLEEEANDAFLVAVKDDQIVGCLVLTPAQEGEVRMRQVAVSSSLQRSGIGRSLVRASEEYAQRHGFQKILLHARQTAVPFYQSLGYKIEGDVFHEVGIPHRLMVKLLPNE